MKARILLRQLEIPFDQVTVDLFTGETRTPEHFGRNPDGRIPVLELDDGQTIPESNAILAYLAEGTDYLPAERLARTRVLQWMFFEQNRIEGELGYGRFLKLSGRAEQMPEVYENRRTRGSDGLAALERGLSDGREFVAGDYSIAASLSTGTSTAPTTQARASTGTTRSGRGSGGWRPRRGSRTISSRCPRTR
jgi:glutathione S-transferase